MQPEQDDAQVSTRRQAARGEHTSQFQLRRSYPLVEEKELEDPKVHSLLRRTKGCAASRRC